MFTETQDQTPHADRPDNNNTEDLATHSKHTTQLTKDQQENEQITGDIFYPFSIKQPTPKNIYTTRGKPPFEYKTRPTLFKS